MSSSIPPSSARLELAIRRANRLGERLEREEKWFNGISHEHLLPSDEFTRSRTMERDTSRHRSQSLPRKYDRSLQETLGLRLSERQQLEEKTALFPKQPNSLAQKKKYEHEYDSHLSEKIKQARNKHPELPQSRALILERALTDSEASRYFGRLKQFKGEKASYDNLFAAVSTGQLAIVDALLKAEGHGFTPDECQQFREHSQLPYRENVSKHMAQFRKDPQALQHILDNTRPILELSHEELAAAAMAATPQQARENPLFMAKLVCLPGQTDWQSIHLLIQKGANVSFNDLADVMRTLTIKESQQGGSALTALSKARRVGLIPHPPQFLADLAAYRGWYDSSYLGRRIDSSRQTIFESLVTPLTPFAHALLTRPVGDKQAPIAILRSQYEELIPELKAVVDRFSQPQRPSARARL